MKFAGLAFVVAVGWIIMSTKDNLHHLRHLKADLGSSFNSITMNLLCKERGEC